MALPDRRVQAAPVWIKAERLQPLIPRETPRFTALTAAAPLLSASSDASRTSGELHRSASVVWIGFGCTPT